MSITPNPITAGLMRIQDMERVKRLKSSLQHKKGERERSTQSGIVCEGPAVSVW